MTSCINSNKQAFHILKCEKSLKSECVLQVIDAIVTGIGFISSLLVAHKIMGYFTTNGALCVLVTWLHQTLCNPVDCSLQGSSVHGILQARILE